MSSALTPVMTPRPADPTARTYRRRLRLVEPDERRSTVAVLCPDVFDDHDGWVTPGDWDSGSARATTRLTRRGRLVVTLAAMVAVAALAVVLATSVDAAAPRIDHVTTVSAGQTLSEVAAAQLPNLPIHQAVAQIQLLNGLNTSQVRAGQSLLIPSMP